MPLSLSTGLRLSTGSERPFDNTSDALIQPQGMRGDIFGTKK